MEATTAWYVVGEASIASDGSGDTTATCFGIQNCCVVFARVAQLVEQLTCNE